MIVSYDFVLQKLFGKKKQRYQQGIQEKEKHVRQLRQRVKALQVSFLLPFLLSLRPKCKSCVLYPLSLRVTDIIHHFFFHCQSAGDAAVEQNEKAHAEVVQMAAKRHCAVKELIRVQENAAVSRAEALVDRLEKEISELRKGEDELKQLSLTEDHIHFLQVQ